jgi:hypothetical protein
MATEKYWMFYSSYKIYYMSQNKHMLSKNNHSKRVFPLYIWTLILVHHSCLMGVLFTKCFNFLRSLLWIIVCQHSDYCWKNDNVTGSSCYRKCIESICKMRKISQLWKESLISYGQQFHHYQLGCSYFNSGIHRGIVIGQEHHL